MATNDQKIDNKSTVSNMLENPMFQTFSKKETEKPSLSEYMEQLTSEFGEELDNLRQKEIFDHNKLQLLIESLRAGHKIYE
ncbi:ribosome assembly protein Rsa3 [Schizosaccharomyces pombe]|uniref:Ribosome assembly protein 3 n=1 Tax=Schizosaccharomyces pombe (strain 972 / ATCC 24843) TaxID=284812 RepID=RSA3_SCHPO|nr:putative ribosome assembly protein Rsa3 [Schizosaccharomyces pombe]G2TRL3.1 RecName: Full=Ribosome assembly protein 3 [Schizosaccharomyces pombe 972h-]CCD31318.1 ribosome assembly protein Rsa3 (predicted) [Schizosaccharomyces pombe]|eukprot:NP_001343108.1 putative ribosome assembly protein Rsa3 [Schizosaccharomyces pombe]